MKKNFKLYIICWAILFVIFNVIAFAVPCLFPNTTKYSGSFGIGYTFISLAFIGQLICSYFAIKTENAKKLFLNIPLLTISYTSLILVAIVSAIFMAVPILPTWIGAVICITVFGLSAISVIKAKIAADIVSEIDDKVKTKAMFIKSLTIESENLVLSAKSTQSRAAAQKVYEVVRYSDPMSNIGLADIESQIAYKFNSFSNAVENNSDGIYEAADEIIHLLNDRNKKCKLLK